MTFGTRRTFLYALSSLPLIAASRRKTLVLVDLGSSDVTGTLVETTRSEGYEGFIAGEAAANQKPRAIRAELPRFEDSMDDAAKELKRLAELASAHGAEALIATHPGLSGNGAFRPVDLERKARTLDIAGAICAGRGLQFLYENHELEFTGNAAEERALMVRTDPKLVSYLLDMGTVAKAGGDPVAFFEPNQKRIAAVRLWEPMGGIAAAMSKAHWNGWLVAPGGAADYRAGFRKLIRDGFGV